MLLKDTTQWHLQQWDRLEILCSPVKSEPLRSPNMKVKTAKISNYSSLIAASEFEGILSDWKIQACCIKDTSSSAIKALDNQHMSMAQVSWANLKKIKENLRFN